MSRACLLLSLALLTTALAASGCSRWRRPPDAPLPGQHAIYLVDVARPWGVAEADYSDMLHGRALASIASGASFGDFNDDGWLDLAINRGPFTATNVGANDRLRVFLNDGRRHFVEASREVGVDQRLYGNGAYFVDYDNDGDADLFTTNYDGNRLWRNRGDGTFEDVTAASGLGAFGWTMSAAWFDFDKDGWLDVYVLNYLQTTLALEFEFSKTIDPRTPSDYEPWANHLYRNNGDGTFTDVTASCGCDDPAPGGKSLALVAADLDEDGWPDLYIANDTTMNTLYHNNGDGTFTNIAVEAGVAFNPEGLPEGSMGVALGDPNGDGLPDLFVTNFVTESNRLYINLGDNIFVDLTREAGLDESSRPYVGWGAAFVDLDLDGDEDLVVANGQLVPDFMLLVMRLLSDRVKPGFARFLEGDYNQPVLVYENAGDATFRLVADHGGASIPEVAGRGLAVGDIDNDGDRDIYIRGKDARSLLLENRSRRAGAPVEFVLRGTTSNRMGLGTTVHLETSAGEQWRWVELGGSFLSGSQTSVHFGVPAGATIERVTFHWPSGQVDTLHDLAADNRYHVVEGSLRADALAPAPLPPGTRIADLLRPHAAATDAFGPGARLDPPVARKGDLTDTLSGTHGDERSQ